VHTTSTYGTDESPLTHPISRNVSCKYNCSSKLSRLPVYYFMANLYMDSVAYNSKISRNTYKRMTKQDGSSEKERLRRFSRRPRNTMLTQARILLLLPTIRARGEPERATCGKEVDRDASGDSILYLDTRIFSSLGCVRRTGESS
jgi:hypothetical protein